MNAVYYIRVIIYAFAISSLLGAAVAVIGDSANLFRQGYETRLAEALNSSLFVYGITNYDQRLVQKLRLKDFPPDQEFDTIVLGSSRAMPISERFFNCKTLNLSVSGATIQDYIALYHVSKKLNPKRIFLVVDPWVFNAKNGLDGWKSLQHEFIEETGGADTIIKTIDRLDQNVLLQLFNISYITSSAYSLVNFLKQEKISTSVIEEKDTNKDGLRPDGSRIFNSDYANLSNEQVEVLAAQYSQPPIFGLSPFYKIDPNYWLLFTKLIDNIKKRSEVIILLLPYHPTSYRGIMEHASIVANVERQVKQFASEINVDVIGSYDPDMVSCLRNNFFDGMHPKESCIDKILSNWKLN